MYNKNIIIYNILVKITHETIFIFCYNFSVRVTINTLNFIKKKS